MTSAGEPGPALRRIRPGDHDAVVELNQRNVSALAPLPRRRLAELVALADRAEVVLMDGLLAGFVLTFAPGTAYDSVNYREFAGRYGPGFYYLDRIVVHERFRRRGLAGFVYDEVERTAAAYGRLALEVNLVPPNPPSLAFHRGRGYVEVGRLGDQAKQVALMVKELP